MHSENTQGVCSTTNDAIKSREDAIRVSCLTRLTEVPSRAILGNWRTCGIAVSLLADEVISRSTIPQKEGNRILKRDAGEH